MKGDRVPIPDDLAAKVMFASDRTCCVCREPRRKAKIHHIDQDPSNNVYENLAVVCDDCHSDAHTRHAFARNLTPALIQEYNASWRAIVRGRLSPHAEDGAQREYRLEALLDLSLAPHRWKSHYMALYPGHFEGVSPRGADIWDTIADSATHRYSETEWRRYAPLFEHSLSELIRRIEQLLTQHAPVIPTALKTAAVRVIRQLEVEQSVYQMIPILKGTTPDGDVLYDTRFKEVVRRLGVFARQVDASRRSIEQDT